MMTLYRAPLVAVILIVLLRISIGWQFLYEGLWKKQTLSSNNPWTSEGYLKNAQGPLRNYFRDMLGDPDDLDWLDYAKKSQDWYTWRDRFVTHYNLDDAQKQRLNILLDGSADIDTPAADLPPVSAYRASLAALPDGVTAEKLGSAVKYDSGKKEIVLTGSLLPSEEAALLNLVDVTRKADGSYGKKSNPEENADAQQVDFLKAIERVATQSRQLSFRHKLAAQLRGNPENVGVAGRKNDRGSFDIVMDTVTVDEAGEKSNNVRYGKIQEYKDLIADYNASVAKAKIDYQNDHATMLGRKLAIVRGELVSPIRALDKELKNAAINLLKPEQLAKGAPPRNDSPLARSDNQVMWGLIVLGIMLIAGLGTRVAAVLGAVMLMMFYMVMPPWPGVPQVPGPEHSFIVNKNMIEAIALLAIAALPTGSWFGVDGIIRRLALRCCPGMCGTGAASPAAPKPAPPQPAAKA
ncbi:DoxX family protein [Planctomicrobium sp. SH527]|uniref:DoxX family protein n=1 Tax=Planctomicrobium sp. SH527 TaxID=3448123 RepID=UPI003F5BF2F0